MAMLDLINSGLFAVFVLFWIAMVVALGTLILFMVKLAYDLLKILFDADPET